MADVSADVTQLYAVARAIGNVPDRLRPRVRAAVQFNLQLVKNEWRESLQGIDYAPRVPYSISYDTKELANSVEGEVGANKYTGQQGGVALLLEYGAASHNTGARGYGLAAFTNNADDLDKGIGIALADAVTAAGL